MSDQIIYHSNVLEDINPIPREVVYYKYFKEEDGKIKKYLGSTLGHKFKYFYHDSDLPSDDENDLSYYFIPKNKPSVTKESFTTWRSLNKKRIYNLYGTDKTFRLENVTNIPLTFLYKNINIMYFDIEVYVKEDVDMFDKNVSIHEKFINPITAISLVFQDNRLNKIRKMVLVYDILNRRQGYEDKHEDFEIYYYTSESKLLLAYLELIRIQNPDIITGWNIEYFDLPYIYTRICKLISPFRAQFMSPYAYTIEKKGVLKVDVNPDKIKFIREDKVKEYIKQNGVVVGVEENTKISIAGINCIDYMKLYRKNNTSKDGYSLKSVSQDELGKSKVDYDDYGNINGLFEKNLDLFIKYNMEDSNLIMDLENKLGYFKVLCVESAMIGIQNIERSLSTVGPWENLISRKLQDKGLVEIWIKKEDKIKKVKFPAALDLGVESIVGETQNAIINYDFTSLYPTTIMSLNISPETRISITEDYGEYFHKKQLIFDLHKNKDTLILKDKPRKNSKDYFLNPIKQKINDRYLGTGIHGEGIQDIDKVLLECNNTDFSNYVYGVTSFYSKENLGIIPEIMKEVFDLRVSYKNMVSSVERLQKNIITIDEYKKEIKKLGLQDCDENKTILQIVSEANRNEKDLEEMKKFIDKLQDGLKLFMNSGYGAFGNKYFKYFNIDMATSITISARKILNELIQRLGSYINDKFNSPSSFKRVLYGATDSIFITFKDLFEKNMNEYTNEQIVNKIFDTFNQLNMDNFFKDFYNYIGKDVFNVIQNKFNIEMEKVMSEGIWFGKKNYIVKVIYDKTIKKDRKPKIKGLVLKKTTSPLYLRDKAMQEKVINTIFSSRKINSKLYDIVPFVLEMFEDFKKVGKEDIYKIASNVNISTKMLTKYVNKDITQILVKQCPAQIKGVTVWNNLLKKYPAYRDYVVKNEGFNEKGCVISVIEDNEYIIEDDVNKNEIKKLDTEKRLKKGKAPKKYITSISLPVRRKVPKEIEEFLLTKIDWVDQFESTVLNIIEKYLPCNDTDIYKVVSDQHIKDTLNNK